MDGGNSTTSGINRSRARKYDRRPRSDNIVRSQATMNESQRNQPSTVPQRPNQHPIFDEHYHNEHRSRRARLRLPPLDPNNRYVGDGLDFRRPVTAAVETYRRERARWGTEMIDLTRDAEPEPTQSTPVVRTQRLPRYGRDIIDISSSDDDENMTQVSPTNAPHGQTQRLARSPTVDSESLFVQEDDLEFLRSQPLSRNTSRPASVLPGAMDGQSPFIDLTEEAEDDVVMTNEVRRLHRPTSRRLPSATDRVLNSSIFGGLAGMLPNTRLHDRFTSHYENTFQGFPFAGRFQSLFTSRPEPGIHHAHEDPSHRTRDRGQPIPHIRPGGITMDYTSSAFNLGTGGHQQPGPQQYEAPEPPAAGFTRNPAPDEEVVCPNCGHELAVGKSDVQRQIWAIKQCGHVYCGTCVQARLQTKKSNSDKGKARADAPPLLKKCAVEDCNKPVTKASMVHVFLST